MGLTPARLTPVRMLDNLLHPGLLLALLLLVAMSVMADEQSSTTTMPDHSSSAHALPAIPSVPTAVPSIPATPVDGQTEIQELERHIAERLSRTFDGHHPPQHAANRPFNTDILIPLFAIFFIFGGPVILIIVMMSLHYRAKARRQRQQSENIAQLLAAGRDVPLELLRGDEASHVVAEDNLRKGVKNIGIGTGLLIFLTILAGISIGAVGFIMIGLGISQLVIWKLADNNNAPHTRD